MHFYTPSPLSLGYIPRGSYRPALVPTYLDDESSFAFTSEGLGYPALSQTFSPRLDAETRYRRALYELQAAEEDFEAHLTVKRARQAAILREQAARRQHALAIQAEVERIEHARALEAKLAEEFEWPQRAPRAHFALDRARRQKPALLHAFVDANPRDFSASEHPFADCGPSRRPVLHDSKVSGLEDLLKLFTGIHPQPHSPPQQSSSAAPSQDRSAEPRPSEKPDAPADALNAVLDFIHGLAAHARDTADGSEIFPKPSPVPLPQAAPVDEKGKGKVKAEQAAGPTLLQSLLGAYTQGPSDQELKDIELAIKLSLEGRDATDAKKAGAAKASRSSPGASSSRVNLDGAAPSSASDIRSASKAIPDPVPQPVSPLTTIRAVRNQFSTLEGAFKLPAVLDFDVLSNSPNNASLRAYENTLNGFLEQLDAIESDGDEEVRNVRREVVREVEKALEDLERRVSEQASKLQVTKNVEVKGYAVEFEALAAQDAVPADGAGLTGPEPFAAVSPTDADVDLAIPEEYPPSPPAIESPKPAVTGLRVNAVVQTADGDVSSLDANETAPVLEDPSDSVATIVATPASGPSSDIYVPASPVPETFLASMSHDQFTFPPTPAHSDSGASPVAAQDDAVLVDNSEEGESVKGGEDGWSEVDA